MYNMLIIAQVIQVKSAYGYYHKNMDLVSQVQNLDEAVCIFP